MTSRESIVSESRESIASSGRSDLLTELRLGFVREKEETTHIDCLSKRFERKYGIPNSPTRSQSKKMIAEDGYKKDHLL